MDIIVTGHGNFASGLQSTIQLLAGSIERIHYIDFTDGMSEESLTSDYLELISPGKEYLFFCDLVGGTPYKTAARISAKDTDNIGVVAGCNIGSLLEVGLSLSDQREDIDQFTEELVRNSLRGTQVFKFKPIQHEEITDGI